MMLLRLRSKLNNCLRFQNTPQHRAEQRKQTRRNRTRNDTNNIRTQNGKTSSLPFGQVKRLCLILSIEYFAVLLGKWGIDRTLVWRLVRYSDVLMMRLSLVDIIQPSLLVFLCCSVQDIKVKSRYKM